MGIVEFAIVALKPGFSAIDAELHTVLDACIMSLHAAPGGTSFEFRQQVEDPGRICLLGGWQTVEDHADFLLSGESQELLARLSPYIQVERVFHIFLDVDRLDLKAAEIEVGVYVMGEGRKGDVQRLADEQDGHVVGGWKAKKSDKTQFGKALAVVKEQLKQEKGNIETETHEQVIEDDIWVSYSTVRDAQTERAFRQGAIALGAEVEVLHFHKFAEARY
jgi:quinol monooxygenase YgiN